MRYSADHKATARARIIGAAARAIRVQGLEAPTVPSIMREAGLTHGGFYHHFPDRDAMIVEAIAASSNETLVNVLDAPGANVESMLARYLSEEHVANPAMGCVIAAAGAEASHASAPAVRKAFATVARGFIAQVERVTRSTRTQGVPASKRVPRAKAIKRRTSSTTDALDDEALVIASRMIGAVVLARLVDDKVLAGRILAAARHG